jgi:hypothetical protein
VSVGGGGGFRQFGRSHRAVTSGPQGCEEGMLSPCLPLCLLNDTVTS